MSAAELQLFQELYETMLHSIRGKDKTYKVKKVLIAEDESYITDNESSLDSKPAASSSAPKKSSSSNVASVSSHHSNYKSTKQSKSDKMRSLLYSDDEEEANDSDHQHADSDEPSRNTDKKKKTKAVCEYREAMTRLAGGKGNSLSANVSSSKKCLDKVLITESEFSANENWLIEDIEKRSEHATANRVDTHERTSSTKRKYAKKAEKSESENEESVRNNHLNEEEDDEEEDDYLMFKKNRNPVKSPISKKRLIDDEENCEGKVYACTGAGDLYFTEEDSNDASTKAGPTSERSPLKSNNSLNSLMNKGNKHVADLNDEHQDDLVITSPFKRAKFGSKHKTQLKITSMVKHCSLKSSSDHEMNDIMIVRETLPRVKEATTVSTSTRSNESSSSSSDKNQTWKIKAIVDNKNFLIPVS